jgi:hypothetical protein
VKNLLFILLTFSGTIKATSQVIIQPGFADGKDATIDTTRAINASWYTPRGNNPYGGFGMYWCYPDGFNVICSAKWLIDFSLEELHLDTSFSSAKLILHGESIDANPVTHVTGFNIVRIISSWDENTVLWATQPRTDTTQKISFDITDTTQSPLIIDVTSLIKTILIEPDTSYGLMIELEVSNLFGSVTLYTSENADSTKHPKLVFEYPSVGIGELKEKPGTVTSFPNPFSNQVTFENLDHEEANLTFYDISSHQVFQKTFTSSTTISTEHLAQSIYFYEVRNENGLLAKGKLVKE